MTRPLRQVPDVRADEVTAQLIEARIDRGDITPDEVRKILGGASAIREYLETKAAEPAREWMRREPRATHPEILDAVREFVAGGGFYDDDAEQYVENIAGDLPEHHHHAHEERHPLTVQLGSEIYLARRILDDEKAEAKIAALHADGFALLDDVDIVNGGRYEICTATLYAGRSVLTYSDPQAVRARVTTTGLHFLPPRARSRGYRATGLMLVRAA